MSFTDDAHRFAFGDNWAHFLSVLDDERIAIAQKSLIEMLVIDTFVRCRFLDIGYGSGLVLRRCQRGRCLAACASG